jgi:protein associated with RNAse G/E
MGLTKQYLKYAHSATFNIIASSRSNGCFVNYKNTSGRFFISAAAENILIWDLR